MTKHVMSSRDSKKAIRIVLRQHSAQALMLRNLLAGQVGDYLQTLQLMVSDLIPGQWSSGSTAPVRQYHQTCWSLDGAVNGRGGERGLYTQIKTGRGIGKKVVEKCLHL